MSAYRVVHDYACSPEQLWRALTDPEIVPRWTASGRGGQPVGFRAVVGTRFRYVAKPAPGWNGVVECEVLAVEEPTKLRYTWVGDPGSDVTIVENRLATHDGGTRLTWEHTGFTGVGGFFMAALLGSVRKKMLRVGLPAVLATLAVLLGVVTPARADETSALTARLTALRNERGRVGCALYGSARGFPKDRGAALQTTWCPIEDGAAACAFTAVPVGTYAIACFHDENDNGKLDTGVFGIPKEGVAASNDAKGTFGPPSFADARFAHGSTTSEVTMRIKY